MLSINKGTMRTARRFNNKAARIITAACTILSSLMITMPHIADAATPEVVKNNISISVPTKVQCAVKADGTVIAPKSWTLSNTGTDNVEIDGMSITNAVNWLTLTATSNTLNYAIGDGTGHYTLSYTNSNGSQFLNSAAKPLCIPHGKSSSWTWKIGKLNRDDHGTLLDSMAKGTPARLCDISFSYSSVGTDLSTSGISSTVSGNVNGNLPLGGTATISIANKPSKAKLAYQWYTVESNGTYTAIQNATSASFKTTAAYKDKKIVCRVTDTSGHFASHYDAAQITVKQLSPAVSLSGSATYGQKLTAVPSGLPTGQTYAYTYKWQRFTENTWNDISGASTNAYTLAGDDVGHQVCVVVTTATSPYIIGTSTATSATVTKAKATISASITGTKNNSSKLTVGASNLPSNGSTQLSYKWQYSTNGSSNWIDSAASDSTSNTIQMQATDYTRYYRCIVSATNPYHEISQATTAAYGPIAKSTVSAAKVSISGDAIYNGTLKANVTGIPTVGTNSVTYQWQYASAADDTTWYNTSLETGTSPSLTFTKTSSVGHFYRCVITIDNSYYIVPGVTSPVTKIGKATAQTTVTISGNPAMGQSLTAKVNGLPTVGTNNVSYQWQSSIDGTNWGTSTMSGAKTATLHLYDDADKNHSAVGYRFRCVITVSGNTAYDIKGSTSNALGPVTKGSTTAPTIAINGTKKIESKLTASVTGLPKYGTNKLTYQWQTSTDGSTWINSTQSDAKSSTFTPANTLINQYIRCVASATNEQYDIPTGYSASYGKLGKATKTLTAAITSPNKRNGDILTCNVSGLGTGTNNISYKWECSHNSSFTNIELLNDTGKAHGTSMGTGTYYRCTATVSGNQYYDYNAPVSPIYGPLAKGIAATPTVTISGSNTWGSTLKATVSNLPKYGTNKIAYQWEARNDADTAWTNSGYSTATTDHIVVNATDAISTARHYRCKVTVMNEQYDVPVAYTADHGKTIKATATISATISGNAVVGGKLTASVSGLPTSGSNAIAYQWQYSSDGNNWTNSSGSDAKSNVKTLDTVNMDLKWRCSINATNPYYTMATAYTSATATVGKGTSTAPTVTISGNKTYGATLTANVSGQPAGTTATTYQWQRADSASGTYTNIANATGKTYTIGTSDMSKYIRVTVSTTSTYYNVGQGYAAGYGPIGKATASISATSSGSKTIESALTANVTGLPSIGTNTVSYQWQYSNDNKTWANSNQSDAKTKTITPNYTWAGVYARCIISVSGNTYYNINGYTLNIGQIGKGTVTTTTTISGDNRVDGSITALVSGLPNHGINNISYQWQCAPTSDYQNKNYYDENGNFDSTKRIWTNSSHSDANKATYSLAYDDAREFSYRCIVTISGNSYYNIIGSTSDATNCGYGNLAAYSPTASVTGDSVIDGTLTCKIDTNSLPKFGKKSFGYTWEFTRDNGKTWVEGASLFYPKSSSVTVPNSIYTDDNGTEQTLVGTQFRCAIEINTELYRTKDGMKGVTIYTNSVTIKKGTKPAPTISISGNKIYGATLTATISGLPAKGNNIVTYQWQKSDNSNGAWTNIDNTNSRTYVIKTSDMNKYIRVTATISNPLYNIGQALSSSYGSITKATVTPTATLGGTALTGGTLTCTVSNLPTAGTNNITYQWQYSKDGTSNWTNSTYSDAKTKSLKLQGTDINWYYRCVVNVSGNAYYNINSATTAATKLIGKGTSSAPIVTISGGKTYGSSMTASVSNQPSGTTATTYQWQFSSDSGKTWKNSTWSGATTNKIASFGSDFEGKYFRCMVTTASSQWNVPTAYSAAYGPLTKGNKTISVTISGTKNNTSKLTASVSGLPTIGTNTISYQWQWSKDGSTGWTNSTYSDGKDNIIQMKAADVNYYYRCTVSVSGNSYYNVTGATSAAYGPMTKSSHSAPTVSISGNKVYGATLTANVSGQPTGTTATSYQWQRASSTSGTWSNINGETAGTYKASTSDMNQYLRVLINTTNTYYNVSQGVSAAYGTITKATATISATVIGDKVINSPLTINITGLPSVGTNTVSYQWQYSSDNATWTNSTQSDAKSSSFTPNSTWAGMYARCVISANGNQYYNINGCTIDVGVIRKEPIFAIYSATDNSLTFYNRAGIPTTKSTFNGKEVTDIYIGFENQNYTATTIPWASYAKKITSVSFADTIKPSNTTYWFYGFTTLTNINISKLSTSTVTNMCGMFAGCAAITSLDLSKLDTRNVTNMSGMFMSCTKLSTIDLSNCITSNVTIMNSMFANCKALKTINLTKFTTNASKNMQSMFANCSSLTSLNLSTFNTSKVTTMQNMFMNCYKLATVTLGTNFKWIGTNGYLPTPSSAYINGADGKWYIGNTGYAPNAIPSNKAATYSAIAPTKTSFAIYSADDKTVKLYRRTDIPKVGSTFNGKTVTLINTQIDNGGYLFSSTTSAKDATSIAVIDSDIKPKSMKNWFMDANNVTTMNLSKLDTSECTDMSGAFGECQSLETLDISMWNTSKVTTMKQMFFNCIKLSTLKLSNLDTSQVTDMEQMFIDCRSLELLDVSNFNTLNVTNMKAMFWGCAKLSTLFLAKEPSTTQTPALIPSRLEMSTPSFNNKNAMCDNMFTNCTSLTKIVLGPFFYSTRVTFPMPGNANINYTYWILQSDSKKTLYTPTKLPNVSGYVEVFIRATN